MIADNISFGEKNMRIVCVCVCVSMWECCSVSWFRRMHAFDLCLEETKRYIMAFHQKHSNITLYCIANAWPTVHKCQLFFQKFRWNVDVFVVRTVHVHHALEVAYRQWQYAATIDDASKNKWHVVVMVTSVVAKSMHIHTHVCVYKCIYPWTLSYLIDSYCYLIKCIFPSKTSRLLNRNQFIIIFGYWILTSWLNNIESLPGYR